MHKVSLKMHSIFKLKKLQIRIKYWLKYRKCKTVKHFVKVYHGKIRYVVLISYKSKIKQKNKLKLF